VRLKECRYNFTMKLNNKCIKKDMVIMHTKGHRAADFELDICCQVHDSK